MELFLANEDRLHAHAERAVAEKVMAGSTYGGPGEDDDLEIVGDAAIINVVGGLQLREDFWSWLFGGCSYESICRKVEMAESSAVVKRIIMRFDTPGGGVQGVTECGDMIHACKKPTTAVVDPECASAGLWLATQCDRIVSIKAGMIGSLGVQLVSMNKAKMLQDMGVDCKIFRASISPNKNLGHPMEPRTEEADAEMQALVNKWGDRFVAAVGRGRGCTPETVVEKFGQGKMFEAPEAVSIGLIDEIGTLNGVLNESTSKGSTGAKARRIIV